MPTQNTLKDCFASSRRIDVSTMRGVIRLWLLLIVVRVSSVKAGLNLNFRSKQLSNIMGQKESSREQKQPKKESPDLLRLDLSGRLQILIAGHQQEEEPPTKVVRPLLPLKVEKLSSNPFVPKRVNLAVDYDFAQSIWGIIRVVPEAVWDVSHSLEEDSLYRPQQVGVSIQQGIAPGMENALATEVRWKNPWRRWTKARASPVLRIRCKETGLASISCGIPLHPRMSYEGSFSKDLWGPPTRLPLPDPTTRQQDWWLPDICINALGAMQAHNQIWMGRPSEPRLGFRLTVRKQLEWSVLNSPLEQDTKTHISLQVEGAASQWSTGMRLESSLDEPLATARLALSTRWHVSRSNGSE